MGRSNGLRILLAAGLLAACATGTTWVKPSADADDIRSIAVMPFTSNKSGLGQEIANRFTQVLLQLDRFQVRDASLVRTQDTKRTENTMENSDDASMHVIAPEFAASLDVDAVLTGTVRRYGNWFTGKNMNVDAKLVSRSGVILWTCNYKTDWAFTGLGTEGSLASKIVKETMKRFRKSFRI